MAGWFEGEDEDLHEAIRSAEDTWNVQSSDPFFDSRLVVDTASHLVATSYRLRYDASAQRESAAAERDAKMRQAVSAARAATAFAEVAASKEAEATDAASSGAANSKPPSAHKAKPLSLSRVNLAPRANLDPPQASKDKPATDFLQASVACAHAYMGADRLALELVPRSRQLREQLRDTVGPLCWAVHASTREELRRQAKAQIEAEVERFLSARLVACDVGELFSYDCFSEDEAHGGAEFATPPSTAPVGSERADKGGRARAGAEQGLEPAVRRFEARFWKMFCTALGRSLFGDLREDLVGVFGEAAEGVFARYEGELQLAVNALMGCLPSWTVDSIFFAFVGLPVGTAARQRAEKYSMLHRCLKYIIHSSGRYVFVSTPAWYLPLVTALPPLSRREQVRMMAGQSSVSLRLVWPSVCLDAEECVAAVDAVWGGSIPGKRAKLQLCQGVSSLGIWVLRMTMGCERLVSAALGKLREYAPLFEQMYDRLVQDKEIVSVELPSDEQLALHIAEVAADLVAKRAMNVKKRTSRGLGTTSTRLRKSSKGFTTMKGILATSRAVVRLRRPVAGAPHDPGDTSADGLPNSQSPRIVSPFSPTSATSPTSPAAAVSFMEKAPSIPLDTISMLQFQLGMDSPASARTPRAPPPAMSSSLSLSRQLASKRARNAGRQANQPLASGGASPDSSTFDRTPRSFGTSMGQAMLQALQQDTRGRSASEEAWLRRAIQTGGGNGFQQVTWPLGSRPSGGVGLMTDLSMPGRERQLSKDGGLNLPARGRQLSGFHGTLGREWQPAGLHGTLGLERQLSGSEAFGGVMAEQVVGRIPLHDPLQNETPEASAAAYVADALEIALRIGAAGPTRAKEPIASDTKGSSCSSAATTAQEEPATAAGSHDEEEQETDPQPAAGRRRSLLNAWARPGAPLLTRCRSAPAVLRTEGQSLSVSFESSRGTEDRAARRRARSAPAAVDASDFDAGDPIRNTAVALALMKQVSQELSSACSEGPLHLAWRMPKSEAERRQLTRLRLTLGAVLMFAAQRAPLPSAETLNIQHFTIISKELSQGPACHAVALPDGVFILGCIPMFHTAPSAHSFRIPPRDANTFHVAIPLVLLESQQLCAVLQERRVGKRWTEGSLLMLFVSGALLDAHSRRSEWAAVEGCWRQNHEAFFPMLCAFRLLLGIELVHMWYVHRRPPKPPMVEHLLKFIMDVPSRIRNVPMVLDMGAEDGRRPLIAAPFLAVAPPPLPAAEEKDAAREALFDTNFLEWAPEHHSPDGAVPLQDFAAWVAQLKPGRIVHSSHLAQPAEFYIRLEDAVLIIKFLMWEDTESLCPMDFMKAYSSAVGEPEWWGVPLVTFVVVSNFLPKVIERSVGPNSCLLVEAGNKFPNVREKNFPVVTGGSELIVCRKEVLEAFLGTHKELVARHDQMFAVRAAPEVASPVVSPRNMASPVATPRNKDQVEKKEPQGAHKKDGNAPSKKPGKDDGLRACPAGAGRVAASSWRARRPALPLHKQAELNFEALSALLSLASSRHDALFDAVDVMAEAGELRRPLSGARRGMANSPGSKDSRQGGEESRQGSKESAVSAFEALAGVHEVEAAEAAHGAAEPAVAAAPEQPAPQVAQDDALARPHKLEPRRTSGELPSSSISKLRATVLALMFPQGASKESTESKEEANGSSAADDDEDDDMPPGSCVQIARVPSPERTSKSRTWRPPTPHPSQNAEKAGRQQAKHRRNLRRNFLDSLAGGFDFLALGDEWRAGLLLLKPESPSKRDRKLKEQRTQALEEGQERAA